MEESRASGRVGHARAKAETIAAFARERLSFSDRFWPTAEVGVPAANGRSRSASVIGAKNPNGC